ncbi:hypothetical protein TIFTF001_028210 [Ficus carica]|uniref:Uncharacterized protein n=1 Tax=Ficus carica TaxID=3494 RepID=A0AA88DPH8_FICCA|nr:hypothetical protein TIFTF001_028210 [Ficus carica]
MANHEDLQMVRSGASDGEARRKPICRGAVIQRLSFNGSKIELFGSASQRRFSFNGSKIELYGSGSKALS